MPSSSRNVISKEVTANRVVDFEPKKFPVVMPEVAKAFVRVDSGPNTTFKVSDLVAQQTGVSAEEKRILEAKVQELVIVQLKQVEERAYQEAYELGLDVGRKQSFDKYIQQYKSQFTRFGDLLTLMEQLINQLIAKNEARIVDLAMKIAEKIAVDHIADKRDVILSVLREVFSELQKDEKVVVKVSEPDLEFIKEVQERLEFSEDLKFLEGHKVESSPDIKTGGCLIETNYGDVDATLEQRLTKLWSELRAKLPKTEVKNNNGQ
jgi:flagellar assembly protein FliH